MNELTYLTEREKIVVLEETIPEIEKLQAELKLTKQKLKQLNQEENELKKYRQKLATDIEGT